jgi:tetratricopeptide (TPR) repeat protein
VQRPETDGTADSNIRAHQLGWLLVIATLMTYAPSLTGGFVWDDHDLIENNPALTSWQWMLTSDLFGPSGRPSDVYRPLIAFGFGLEQALLTGPLLPRLTNLALHLLAAFAIARWARALGATPLLAIAGAALFALHPSASESVAWISGRQDLLPLTMTLCAGAAFFGSSTTLAGALLFAAPFAKESYILAPLMACMWCASKGVWPRRFLGLTTAGTAAYLVVRKLCGVLFWPEAAPVGSFEALGGLAIRGASLLFRPGAPDPLPTLEPSLTAGIVLTLCFCFAITRRKWLAPLSLLLICLPGALAAAHTGLASDRYLLPALAALSLTLPLLGKARGLVPSKAALALAAAIAAGMMIFTTKRAGAWASDRALFQTAYERAPTNPRAAFHLAHALHRYESRCDAALPLYQRAVALAPTHADVRAQNNVIACAIDTHQPELALALAPSAIAADPTNPNPAANAARAAVAVGDLESAEIWAQMAVDRDHGRTRNWVLLGNISGQRGGFESSVRAFQAALRLDPANPEALRGREAAQRQLALRESAANHSEAHESPTE